QASFQLIDLPGSDFRLIWPSLATRSSGCALNAGATFANKASRASTTARRVEELTPPGVVDPPDPPDGGYCVSPMYSLMSPTFRPSASAATTAIHVRVPVPMSCVPILISTDPS